MNDIDRLQEDLVFFEDRSHSKQKNLGKPGAERVSA